MTYVLISENLTFRLCPFPRDNDRSSLNCASMLKGGWWWKSCGRGLNGLYLTNPQDLTARQGYYFFEIISHAKKLNIFFRPFRCCLVSMERLGLFSQAFTDDDSTEELEHKDKVKT